MLFFELFDYIHELFNLTWFNSAGIPFFIELALQGINMSLAQLIFLLQKRHRFFELISFFQIWIDNVSYFFVFFCQNTLNFFQLFSDFIGLNLILI